MTKGFHGPGCATQLDFPNTMSRSDPIIDEIRAIREAIAKASDNDLRKIAEAARARQRASGRQVVTLPPRQASDAKKAS